MNRFDRPSLAAQSKQALSQMLRQRNPYTLGSGGQQGAAANNQMFNVHQQRQHLMRLRNMNPAQIALGNNQMNAAAKLGNQSNQMSGGSIAGNVTQANPLLGQAGAGGVSAASGVNPNATSMGQQTNPLLAGTKTPIFNQSMQQQRHQQPAIVTAAGLVNNPSMLPANNAANLMRQSGVGIPSSAANVLAQQQQQKNKVASLVASGNMNASGLFSGGGAINAGNQPQQQQQTGPMIKQPPQYGSIGQNNFGVGNSGSGNIANNNVFNNQNAAGQQPQQQQGSQNQQQQQQQAQQQQVQGTGIGGFSQMARQEFIAQQRAKQQAAQAAQAAAAAAAAAANRAQFIQQAPNVTMNNMAGQGALFRQNQGTNKTLLPAQLQQQQFQQQQQQARLRQQQLLMQQQSE